MDVGDLVNYVKGPKDLDWPVRPCLILEVTDNHRQTYVTLLGPGGQIVKRVWVGHIEKFHERGNYERTTE